MIKGVTVQGEEETIGLLTPTYWRDLELCELLCESVDRWVTSFAKHYLIVADDEMPLFGRFNSSRREVLAASQFLPSWLRPFPRFISRRSRRYWWSLRTMPVSGWHVQQLLKFGAASSLPFERFCVLDSDVAFFRPFDLAKIRRPAAAPLFYAPGDVASDAPLHARWVQSSHRLLGLDAPKFPADDFIGHIIVWDQRTVRAMMDRIERVTGLEWAEALCRTRDFSEYMLYGYFVRNDSAHMAQHQLVANLPCLSYWEKRALDLQGMRNLIRTAAPHQAAFSVASISGSSVEVIRTVLDDLTTCQLGEVQTDRALGPGLARARSHATGDVPEVGIPCS